MRAVADTDGLTWLADRRAISTIVDIGANDGAYAAYLERTFDAKQVHAVEPLPQHHEQLIQRGFIVHPVALSSQRGRARLHVPKFDAAASIRPLTNRCLTEFPQIGDDEAVELDVEVDTLDELVPDLPPDTLIKIDAQGAELEILQGGRRCIGAAAIVLIEMTFVPLYEGQALFDDVHRELEKAGLSLIGVNRQYASPATGEPLFAHVVYERSQR